VIVLLSTLALADPTVDGLQAELDRNVDRLALEDAEAPWFLGYQLTEVDQVRISASLGGLIEEWRSPARKLGVRVRVGSPQVDNSRFGSLWDDRGFESERLGIEGSPAEIRRSAWLLADAQYKAAVENVSRKIASRRGRLEMKRPDDYVPVEGVRFEAPAAELPAEDGLAEICRELSTVFVDHPDIVWSKAQCNAGMGRKVIVDSAGTRVSMPLAETQVWAAGSVRSEQGTWAWDGASWMVGDVSDLPSLEEMRAETEQAAERLEAWAAAEPLADEYAGPVLFSGDAAVSLFAQLLLPQLSGTPGADQTSFTGEVEPGSSPLRLKRRILPPGFDVVDDPLLDPRLPSSYTHDDAGVPAQRVEVVNDGLVRNLLMSNVPNKDTAESNGHGRGPVGTELRGQPSNVTVSSARQSSWKKMVRQGLTLAAAYDLDYILVVRSLRDADLEGAGSPNFFGSIVMFGADSDLELTAPLDVVRLYKDGREERVRDLEVGSADARTLRDIVAAGGANTQTLEHPVSEGGYETVPVTLTVPDVLVAEMVFAPFEGQTREAPRLQSPVHAARGQAEK